MATYTFTGRLIDKETREGIKGLRVHCWDRNASVNDLLGEAVTDEKGQFTVACEDSVFSDQDRDREPDIFVKVYSIKNLIHTSKLLKNWLPDGKTLEIEITAPPLVEKFFRLLFHLKTPNNNPAVGVQLIFDQ